MKIAGGNKEWFRDVFDKYFEYIRNYLYYLSGDEMLTEDLAQDVFLQLWENRQKVKEETIKQFLFTIARNSFLKNYRRKKTDFKFKSSYLERIENESPEFILEVKEVDEKLQKVLSSLSDKSRVVFLMHRMDDLTYSQIAESLGVSVKAVEKQMSKALAVLRTEFGDRI
jgi:RNA polymerase sigma-70 factor (ECF subfamily)